MRVLLATVAALALAAAGVAYAARGPAVPTPTILSGPSGATAQTAATFAFAGAARLTFECSLDGAGFRACTSPKGYAGLAAGSHAFRVRARDRQGNVSAAAVRSWTIDRSAPSVWIAEPEHGASYGPDRWADACAGVCGVAADPAGVAAVRVSIRQLATGRWWDGAAFAALGETFLTAEGTTRWRLPLALPAPDGAYVVHVRAQDALGNETAPGAQRSATFAVDSQPPAAPQITEQPPALSADRHATFAFRSSEAGVRLRCRLDGSAWRRCAGRASFAWLADGSHTFSVVALDAAGNASPAASVTWTIDTRAPPRPTIVQKPSDPSSDRAPTFAFTDAEAGVTFQCRLDGGGWTTCTSPTAYAGLALGRHRFRVRALDAAGNESPAAEWTWKVVLSQTGEPFLVSGDLAGLLAPGLAGELALTIANPNDEPIFVTSLTVGVEAGSTNPGCDGPANLEIAQSNVSAASPLVVPANGSASVPSGGVTAPQVLMRNLPINQDACKGATFRFAYGGSAHS